MQKVLDSDSALRVKAIEQAGKIVDDIATAFKDPSKPPVGESLKAYQELKDWGWLDDFPIHDAHNQAMYRKMIAMDKFRHLRWQRDLSKEKGRTKWDKVMGRTGR